MSPRPPRPSRRLLNSLLIKHAGRAGLLLLLSATIILAASCRSPASPGMPPPSEPTVNPSEPADTPDALPPPVLTATGDTLTHGPGEGIHLAQAGEGAQEVTLWFAAALDAGAEDWIRVEPEQVLSAIVPADGDDLGRPPTGLRLFLTPSTAGDSPVTITVEPGLSAADGRTLAQPAVFEIIFTEPTYAHLAVSGSTYLGSGEQRFTGVDSAVHLPILRPGPAVLEARFTRGVDQEAFVEALQRLLPPDIRTGVPSWSDDGTELRLTLFQNVTQALDVRLSLVPAPGQAPARDLLGMPLAASEPDLRWIVAAPAGVMVARTRDGSPHGPVEPVGQLPQLPLLDPAGTHALRAGRLLAWHPHDGGGDCPNRSLTLWEPAAGTGVTLAGNLPGCLAWAAWLDDDTVALVGRDRATRYRIPRALPLAELPGSPQAAVLWTSEAGAVVGAALAPGAPIAVFHAPEAGTADGGATDLGGSAQVDLIILNSAGQVVQRYGQVSDLVSQEPTWRPLPAAWSPDGRRLAFVSYRSSPERGEGGYPWNVNAQLVILDNSTGRMVHHDLAPLDLIWNPGTMNLWVRTGDGWLAVDPAAGTVQPVNGDVWWALAFSPDGRYLMALTREGAGILDAVTGAHVPAAGFKPLGWDPVDGRAYWQGP